jgi:hypothetical protein
MPIIELFNRVNNLVLEIWNFIVLKNLPIITAFPFILL